ARAGPPAGFMIVFEVAGRGMRRRFLALFRRPLCSRFLAREVAVPRVTEPPMLIPFVLAASLALQDAKAAAPESPANSLADAAQDVTDKTALEAVAWARFLGAGCKGAADCFGTTEHADADLLLGGAIETAVKTAVDGLAGKKGKVKLNDAAE